MSFHFRMVIVVIGGTGHIGTYLIPRLVAARHQVILVSRGERKPYQAHAAWRSVRRIRIDRGTVEGGGGLWPAKSRAESGCGGPSPFFYVKKPPKVGRFASRPGSTFPP